MINEFYFLWEIILIGRDLLGLKSLKSLINYTNYSKLSQKFKNSCWPYFRIVSIALSFSLPLTLKLLIRNNVCSGFLRVFKNCLKFENSQAIQCAFIGEMRDSGQDISTHTERERVGGVLWLEAVRTLLISKCPSPARASTPVGVLKIRPVMGQKLSNPCRYIMIITIQEVL